MWNFQTDPEFQTELDWVENFVRSRIHPLDQILGSQWNIHDPEFIRLIRPLQREVKERGLWACHLGPELGGAGYGQVKLALLNEKLGISRFGPITFGVQAPDTGNAEIIARFGTAVQKQRYLQPLLANEVVSCFAMTEPHGGADPTAIRSMAVRDGDHWVINGEKWFASEAEVASFFIMMVVTEPEAESPHERASMFFVPAGAPGLNIVRNYGFYGEKGDTHAHLRIENLRVHQDEMLGSSGQGFAIAQSRLGGGRLHHAMRTIAQASRAFEMMSERAVSRTSKGERLADKQMVQAMIADSWIQLRQFRLLVLEAAWLADQGGDWKTIRRHISAVKVAMPAVLHDIASRAVQIHGSLGLSHDLPLIEWVVNSYHVGLADGPTEVHKQVVARDILRGVKPGPEVIPTYAREHLQELAHELAESVSDHE